MKKSSHKGVYWKTQLPIDYLDTTLVQNNWETVIADLSDGKPTRLWFIVIEQTNDTASDETLELEITIDGTAYTWTMTATSGTQYFCIFLDDLTAGDFTTFAVATTPRTVGNLTGVAGSIPFIRDRVSLIRVRQTTTVDPTSAQIELNVVWDRLEP